MAKRSKSQERVYLAAQKYQPRMQAIFVRAANELQKSVNLTELAQALERGDTSAAIRMIDIRVLTDVLSGRGGESAKAVNQEAMIAGAAAGRDGIPKAIASAMRFDVTNPRSVRFLGDQERVLLKEVAESTQRAVNNIVLEAIVDGQTTKQQARIIRDSVGLTEKQSRAVKNFRLQLENRTNTPDGRSMQRADMRRLNAIERRQAASQIKRGGMTQAKINGLVDNYRQRLVNLRAQTIARTETNRAANAGQQEQWQQALDDGLLDPARTRKLWRTAGDSRVRETHADVPKLNPDGVGVNQAFRTPDGPLLYPPYGINCLVGDTLVSSGGRISSVTKHFYEGDVITIVTSSGKKITITPNHPVLTDKGWVRAGSIKPEFNVVTNIGTKWLTVNACSGYKQNKVSQIDHLFDTIKLSVGARVTKRNSTHFEFHGDIADGEVAYVATHNGLWNRVVSSIPKVLKKNSFIFAGIAPIKSFGIVKFYAPLNGLLRNLLSSHGIVGTLNLVCARFTSHLRPFKFFSLGLPAWLNSVFDKYSIDYIPADGIKLRNLIYRKSGVVEFDNVVSVDVGVFSGHVYNLHTGFGYYTANGIIVHNCRCTTYLKIIEE